MPGCESQLPRDANMVSIILLMTLILSVSVGNLALGYGLAVHLGHGPAAGWQALCFWKNSAAAHGDAAHAPANDHALAAPAAHAAPAHH